MKGLKEFLELLKKDKVLMSEVEKVKDDTAKIVEIAKKHGFKFSEDEFNDEKMNAVAGGVDWESALLGLGVEVAKNGINLGTQYVQGRINQSQQQAQNGVWSYGQTQQGYKIAINTTNGATFIDQNDGSGWIQM